jgi:hypothetical protein
MIANRAFIVGVGMSKFDKPGTNQGESLIPASR